MMKDNHDSIFQRSIQKGIDKGIIKVESDGSKITYFCKRQYSTSFKNPEERVRASYFCELVLDYNYPTKNIDVEVKVPSRVPEIYADIVVYDEEGHDYLIVECKKDGITDAEFKQAIEQGVGYANALRGKYVSVIAGLTRTNLDIAGYKPSEREKNVIADIPERYGNPIKYKFVKGDKDKELKDKMIYVVNSDKLQNNRINAYYYQPKFEEVEKAVKKGKYENKELKEIIKSLINGFDYREFTDSGVIYLRVSNIRPNRFNLLNVMYVPNMKISKDIKLKQGDVLLTRKGTFGISTVADKDSEKYLISSEIFRIVITDDINPHYLSTWLNSKPQQIIFDRIKTGGIMGHLSQEVLTQIKIPLPPLSIQNKIAEEVKRRMLKAEQLQKEAKEELEKAKLEVEKIILG